MRAPGVSTFSVSFKTPHAAWPSVLLLAFATYTEVFAQDAVKGAALLKAARQAIGGESRLKEIRTLQAGGTFRRVIDGNDTDGDFEIFLEPPGKYLRSEKTGTPGRPSTETIEALVGTELRDVVRGGGGGGRGGGNIGGADAAGGADAPAGGDDPPPADVPEANAAEPGRNRVGSAADPEAQRRARQADVARLMMMWLLTANVPVTWVGIAESPDGKADVLEARFADGQPTRLFLDIQSHMPLMLQWQAAPPAVAGRRGGQRQGGPAAPVTFQMTFSDHRTVNGIKLPYVITKGTNGKTVEQWTIRNYRVNPSFSADTFTR